MKDELKQKKVLDIKQTLLINIFWFVGVFLVIMFFLSMMSFFEYNFLDPNSRLIALIVFLFAFTKLIYWIGQPRLRFYYEYAEKI